MATGGGGNPSSGGGSGGGLVLGTAANIGIAIGQGVQARKQRAHEEAMTKKGFERNMEMSKYQYSQDVDMWNMQNAYNTPREQMQRFKEAGLNPNLIYGQGNEGNAHQLPKYSAPTIDYSGVSSGTANLAGTALANVPNALNEYLNTKAKITQNATLVEQLRQQEVATRVAQGYAMDRAWSENLGIKHKAVSSRYESKMAADKYQGGQIREDGSMINNYTHIENSINQKMLQKALNLKSLDQEFYGIPRYAKYGEQLGKRVWKKGKKAYKEFWKR